MIDNLESILENPEEFLRLEHPKNLGIVLSVSKQSNLDDITFSCDKFVKTLAEEDPDLSFVGVYLREHANVSMELDRKFRSVKYNSSDEFEENFLMMTEPVLELQGNEQAFKIPLISNESIIGYVAFKKKLFREIRVATLASCTNMFNENLDKSIRLRDWKKKAHTDPLTGVHNRRGMEYEGNSLLRQCHKLGRPYSVLMIDGDDFKNINDKHGHLKGDNVLKNIAKIIKSNIRQGFVSRYGGEEFVVVLHNTDKEEAKSVGSRIRRSIYHANILEGENNVTVSIGSATSKLSKSKTNKVKSLYDLIDEADNNLYLAKKLSKNVVYCGEDDVNTGLAGMSQCMRQISRKIFDCNQHGGVLAVTRIVISGTDDPEEIKTQDTYETDLLNAVLGSVNGNNHILDCLDKFSKDSRFGRYCDSPNVLCYKHSESTPIDEFRQYIFRGMAELVKKIDGTKIKAGNQAVPIKVSASIVIYDPSKISTEKLKETVERPEEFLDFLRERSKKDTDRLGVNMITYQPLQQVSQDFVCRQ